MPHHLTGQFGNPMDAAQESGTWGTRQSRRASGGADGFAVGAIRDQSEFGRLVSIIDPPGEFLFDLNFVF